jgi:hypothetical protein
VKRGVHSQLGPGLARSCHPSIFLPFSGLSICVLPILALCPDGLPPARSSRLPGVSFLSPDAVGFLFLFIGPTLHFLPFLLPSLPLLFFSLGSVTRGVHSRLGPGLARGCHSSIFLPFSGLSVCVLQILALRPDGLPPARSSSLPGVPFVSPDAVGCLFLVIGPTLHFLPFLLPFLPLLFFSLGSPSCNLARAGRLHMCSQPVRPEASTLPFLPANHGHATTSSRRQVPQYRPSENSSRCPTVADRCLVAG